MEEKQSLRSLTTYLEIERFRDSLSDTPKNKKVKNLLNGMANIFRYKFEEEKAEEGMKFWAARRREEFLLLREKKIARGGEKR